MLTLCEKIRFGCLGVALAGSFLLGGAKTMAADLPMALGGKGSVKSSELQIASDTVDMDFAERMAVFEGSVEVTDARMTLNADKMIVTLSAQDELQRLEATGNVIVLETGTDRRATAGKAVYDVAKGIIVLTEKPVVIAGENKLSHAYRITYFRDNEKFKFEGRGKDRPTFNLKTGKKNDNSFPAFLGNVAGEKAGQTESKTSKEEKKNDN